MLGEIELKSMAQRINAVLREIGAGHVDEVLRDARAGMHTFVLVLTNYAAWPRVVSARQRFELATGARVTIGHSHGQAIIRVADDVADSVTLEELLPYPPDGVTPMATPIGVVPADPSRPQRPGGGPPALWLQVGSNRSNILIVAPPGMGKTMLAHTILIGLARRNASRPERLRIILCDPKNHDLGQVQAALAAHLDGVHQTIDRTRQALINVAHLVEHAEPSKVETVVFVDELYNVMRDAAAAEAVETTLRMGREFGFRVVACSPEAGRSPLAGPAMGLWHIRLVGRQADVTTAAVASGISGSGAEGLSGAGHFMAVYDGQAKPFRACVPPATYSDAPARIEPEQVLERVLAVAEAQPMEIGGPMNVDDMRALQAGGVDDRESDVQVYRQLAEQLGQSPTVTRWADTRFAGRWDRPYSGARIGWMRERYNAVLQRLASEATEATAESTKAL